MSRLPAPVDSGRFAREVVDHSPDCIKILDAAGRLLWMNDRGLDLMEVCDPAPLLGALWVDFWTGSDRSLAEAAVETARRGGIGRFRGLCRTSRGTPKWWDVIVTQMSGQDGGEEARYLSVSRDVTQLMDVSRDREALLERERQSRTAAEQMARARERALLLVSHELRAPLNAVQGWATFLACGAPPAEVPAAVAAISHNAERLSALLEQLVDAAQYEGKSAPIAVPNPVAALVSSAIEGIAPAARARRIDVSVDAARDDWVMADFRAAQQAMTNILSNAVKFSADGGRIEIRCAAAGDRVRIAVTDDGVGIARDFVPNLFQPFRQAPATRRTGLGLGLSIARMIAEAHGGAIEASSPGPGLGATFTLILPKAERPLVR